MEVKTPKERERLRMSNGTRPSSTNINRQLVPPKSLLDDDMSEDDSDLDQLNGVSLNTQGDSVAKPVFHVNEEYARRFEHNKKREELHRRKSFKLVAYLVLI